MVDLLDTEDFFRAGSNFTWDETVIDAVASDNLHMLYQLLSIRGSKKVLTGVVISPVDTPPL
jgi:hypothetical protein